jgi:hypothetical protein
VCFFIIVNELFVYSGIQLKRSDGQFELVSAANLVAMNLKQPSDDHIKGAYQSEEGHRDTIYWKIKEFYILSSNCHPPGGCIDQAVASPVVRFDGF